MRAFRTLLAIPVGSIAFTLLVVSAMVLPAMVLPAPRLGLAKEEAPRLVDHDLNGLWREVSDNPDPPLTQITQSGNQITALYVDPDPNDGEPAYTCFHDVD